MKKVLCVCLMSIALSVHAQTNCSADEWIKDFVLEAETVSPEPGFLDDLDFSPLWLDSQTCYLGYIGNDYQRLYINFTDIERTSANTYHVKGNSKVKTNICDFEGTIKITGIREYKNIDVDADEEVETQPVSQGYIMADFSFSENKEQKNSGIFSGKLITYWYIDEDGNLLYDDLMSDADGYCNNQFLGTWSSYNPAIKSSKRCAWGHYRIPCSDDLDIGAAEFSVDSKYIKNGWETIVEYDYCAE